MVLVFEASFVRHLKYWHESFIDVTRRIVKIIFVFYLRNDEVTKPFVYIA